MSLYLTLSHIQVQNANCVAGITYGFPAITQFLGFTHALSLKLLNSNQIAPQINLEGCAVICHEHQAHIYKQKVTKDSKTRITDYYFKQTRNPAAGRYEQDKIGGSPSIIEEGKMHLTVSLVIECNGFNGTDADKTILLDHIKNLALTHRLAGGVITTIKDAFLDSSDGDGFRRIRRRLLPGFVLRDRSEYLREHLELLQSENPNAEMIDAWLDFSALKFKAEPVLNKDEKPSKSTKANWKHLKSHKYGGWLVPITTGYQAISKVYPAGEVANTRNPEFPFCFVEAVYGIGEWQSPHKIENLQQILWKYSYEENWYLCKQASIEETDITENNDIDLYILGD